MAPQGPAGPEGAEVGPEGAGERNAMRSHRYWKSQFFHSFFLHRHYITITGSYQTYTMTAFMGVAVSIFSASFCPGLQPDITDMMFVQGALYPDVQLLLAPVPGCSSSPACCYRLA